MRKPTIRSLPLPLALVSGSSATRMVLQSCSSSLRNSSGDQGWRKAARSITITSSRSAAVIRRISSRGRTRTAMLLLRRHRAARIEGIEHAHAGPPAEIGQQLPQQLQVLLLRQLLADLLALRGGERLSPHRFLELAVAQLGGQPQTVVQVPGDAHLPGEDGAHLL